ncbi:universal stress protein [Salinimicrobium tongyeongense]|uniref:Universal stress protein n=1 Tax=Salinimicrobium tongyeongense TaxID=2809707 RepID=A0ABY6NTS2_9FLAO|nr:universal stress protein [Salinimicrobium tongyeongense]UZH56315.1 universal stress protein [Salinimicrobium tongyeongense]
MKTILVPTDFSEQAENALKVAAQLAKKFNAQIYLLHLIELPVDMVNPVGETRSNDLPEAIYFMKLAKKRFDDLLSRPYLKGLEVQDIVEINKAFDGILEASEKHHCDFIVMGSQGASGLKEMFIGSNTEKVVRKSNIPVLVVKNDHASFDVKDFVFATNLEATGREALKKVVELAQLFQARLHLVYINTANEFVTSNECDTKLKKYLEGIDFSNYEFHVFNDDSVEQGILNFSKKMKADLMGIATHGRKGLSHFFNGSISEDLVNHANSPVITFRLEK